MNKNILLNKPVPSDSKDTASNWSTTSVCGSNSETSDAMTSTVDADGNDYILKNSGSQEGRDGFHPGDKIKRTCLTSINFIFIYVAYFLFIEKVVNTVKYR